MSANADEGGAASQEPVPAWMLDRPLLFGLWSQAASIPTRLVPSGRGPGAAPLTMEQTAAGARSDVGKDKGRSRQQRRAGLPSGSVLDFCVLCRSVRVVTNTAQM